MNRLSIARVLKTILRVIAGLALIGTVHAQTIVEDRAPSVPMIIAGSDHAALLAQDTRFDPRLQLRSSLRLGVGTRLARGAELAAGMSLIRATPTSAVPGFSYSGWTGRTIWARFGYFRTGRAPIGVHLTASGVLAGYDATYLLIFFSVIEIAPSLRVSLPGNWSALISIPLGWEIRHDLRLEVGDAFVVPGAPYAGVSTELRLSAPRPTVDASGKP